MLHLETHSSIEQFSTGSDFMIRHSWSLAPFFPRALLSSWRLVFAGPLPKTKSPVITPEEASFYCVLIRSLQKSRIKEARRTWNFWSFGIRNHPVKVAYPRAAQVHKQEFFAAFALLLLNGLPRIIGWKEPCLSQFISVHCRCTSTQPHEDDSYD